MTILSLDSSTKSTGFAVFKNGQLVDYGCITASSTDLFKRIHKMVEEIHNLIIKHSIEKMILEEVRPDEVGARSNLATHKALMFLQGAIAMMIHDNF